MATKTILKTENYSFAYPSAKTSVFEDVNFAVEQGDFVLLVGSTGCGKTTFLKSLLPGDILCGQRSGVVTLPASDPECLTPSIAYVSQSPENQLVCENVWHELAFSLENYGIDRSTMRRRVAEVSHFFGIEPWFHKNVNELSGGQMQIVNLARALATGPKVLLLDEPTAQLDPVAEKNFLHALFRINKELGISIVVVTHAPETVKDYANKGFIFKDKTIEKTTLSRFEFDLQIKDSRRDFSSKELCESVLVDDAYFRYDKVADWVLRGLDLKVVEGEIRALVGGNGCGKSTTLKLIAGIEKSKRGGVANNHKDCQSLMPQCPSALFVCDSVEEEMSEWQKNCRYTDAKIDEMLKKVGLEDKKKLHPFDLSGGQQQLLALAKLLITKPRLMLLDEPTKGLDAKTKLTVARLLLEFAEGGGTVILSTHDLAFASCVCDTCTLIFDGQATCTEHSADFFKNNMFYRPVPCEFTQLVSEQGIR